MYTCSEIDLENYDEIYNDDGKNETNFQEKELRGYLPRINIDKYEAPNLKGDAVNCLLEKVLLKDNFCRPLVICYPLRVDRSFKIGYWPNTNRSFARPF